MCQREFWVLQQICRHFFSTSLRRLVRERLGGVSPSNTHLKYRHTGACVAEMNPDSGHAGISLLKGIDHACATRFRSQRRLPVQLFHNKSLPLLCVQEPLLNFSSSFFLSFSFFLELIFPFYNILLENWHTDSGDHHEQKWSEISVSFDTFDFLRTSTVTCSETWHTHSEGHYIQEWGETFFVSC